MYFKSITGLAPGEFDLLVITYSRLLAFYLTASMCLKIKIFVPLRQQIIFCLSDYVMLDNLKIKISKEFKLQVNGY
jgi:hypothetical protein